MACNWAGLSPFAVYAFGLLRMAARPGSAFSTGASGFATQTGGGAALLADPEGVGLAGVDADAGAFVGVVGAFGVVDVDGAAFGAFSGWWPASLAAAGVLADAEVFADWLGDAEVEADGLV